MIALDTRASQRSHFPVASDCSGFCRWSIGKLPCEAAMGFHRY
jgi:hypothetical protein